MTTRIARGLLDEDQGVDHEGHQCHLVLIPVKSERGQWLRRCLVDHVDPETDDNNGPYYGMPLGREGLTLNDVQIAADHGVDPDLITWLRSEIANRDSSRSRCGLCGSLVGNYHATGCPGEITGRVVGPTR